MELKDRCALVTGSSRGIGKAIAMTLASYGASIAVNYVEDAEKKNLTDAKKEEIEIVLDQLEEVKRKFSQPIVDGILGDKNADK